MLKAPDSGSVVDGTYRNPFFQVTCQIPFGWVDRTSEMAAESDTETSKLLLAAFERPPAATGSTVNAAIVLAVEPASTYPALKTALDYFGPLGESTKAKGFKVFNDAYDFPVDGKNVIREDFSKNLGSITMHQSSLAMLSKGWVLSFTFIAGSDEDVTELIEKLKLTGRQKN